MGSTVTYSLLAGGSWRVATWTNGEADAPAFDPFSLTVDYLRSVDGGNAFFDIRADEERHDWVILGVTIPSADGARRDEWERPKRLAPDRSTETGRVRSRKPGWQVDPSWLPLQSPSKDVWASGMAGRERRGTPARIIVRPMEKPDLSNQTG
jgi:hypothetical protein